ncbi:MAG: ABC transporter ATP-binding protein [Actinomycetota bacterium]|nr:ABC transporter ATP-binding protein [Actinomycetota bacterium]
MLRLEAVSKRYVRGRWVLQDIDLEIPAGEVVAIAGANGSGKSTLLRLLAGLSRPTRGSVSGRPAVIGYVPDRFPPHERLSALEYLTHLGRVRGLCTGAAAGRADQLLDRLALVGGKHSQLRTLSKGNAQKVALAQALLVAPQLLVLDEPWSGLDASAHGTLAAIIAEVAGSGGLVVFTDHRGSISGVHASHTYVIDAGWLSRRAMVTAREPAIEVVLMQPSGRRPPDVDWYGVAGVLEVTGRAETITIRVTREGSDAVLRTALEHGWSVTSLGPIAERTR